MAIIAFPASPQKAISSPVALKTALVVDDSPTILHAVCSLLEYHSIVKVAGRLENGFDVLDTVQSLKPDLLLMDADMPGMIGLRAALVVSQLYPDVKIVLMSMEAGQRFAQACHDCGAHAVIYKPRFLKELSDILSADAAHVMQPPVTSKGAAVSV